MNRPNTQPVNVSNRHVPPLVLVVDDQIATTVMLERMFEFEGYQVRSVYDGISAIDAAQSLIPDLILLDILMPGMNGLDVLKELRKNPITANIPTIILTATDEIANVIHGLELGADDYIRKPFHHQELIARAQSKMRGRQLEYNLQRRTQELQALLRVSEELSQHIAIPELLDFVLYLVLDLLPCALAAIYRLEGSQIAEKRIRLKDGTEVNVEFDHAALVRWSLREKHPAFWNDGQMPGGSSGYPATIIAPMQYGDEISGVLLIAGEQSYDENHVRLMSGIARQAALALRNAELYEIQADYALHLEDMVAERTKELESAHQMLIRAEKLASVGRLAAGIAHEIKNPLMPIHLNLERVIEDMDSGEQVDVRDVEHALASAQRIQHIVDNVLGFTGRGHAAGMEEFSQVDLNDVITGIVELNRKALEHANIAIDLRLGSLPNIRANKYQLEQVFMNLVLNARDAMPDGGRLSVQTNVHDGLISVLVGDNGVGIAPDKIDEIFEPFMTTKEDGNGLGLFISYGIIQNHKGTMEVQSKVGEGTIFEIALPQNAPL